METYIIFNNKNSLDDFRLGVTNIGDLPVANEIVEYENGYTIKTGTYESINIPITFTERELKSIIHYQDEIIDWLTNIKDSKLSFSFMLDKYYIVKNVTVDSISRSFNRYNAINVTFTLEPFKYQHESIITATMPTNLYNRGTVDSQPNIKIHGSGNIQLTINNETIQINNVEEYVELDSKLFLCLNPNGTSKSRDMIGNFPILTMGYNQISWVGAVTKIEILPRTAFK